MQTGTVQKGIKAKRSRRVLKKQQISVVEAVKTFAHYKLELKPGIATGTESWRYKEKFGHAEKGLAILSKTMMKMDTVDELFYRAELHRSKGALILLADTSHSRVKAEKKAETCFLKALDIARQQSAKSLELRATTSLSRLWQMQGKHAEARQMLSKIYNWFTEGFDTPDLQEAKALLAELT